MARIAIEQTRGTDFKSAPADVLVEIFNSNLSYMRYVNKSPPLTWERGTEGGEVNIFQERRSAQLPEVLHKLHRVLMAVVLVVLESDPGME